MKYYKPGQIFMLINLKENRNRLDEENRHDQDKGLEIENMEGIEMEELGDAKVSLKLGKACGYDLKEIEIIKFMGPKGRKWLLNMFSTSWREEKTSEDWDNNIIIPIYKKWEFSDCENYRAICLSSIPYKMYTKYWKTNYENT